MQSEWWVVFPAGNSTAGQVCSNLWRSEGWRTAVFTDAGNPLVKCDRGMTGEYRGVAATFNAFARELIPRGARGMLYCNDDIFPSKGADVETFSRLFLERFPDTFGIAQPTGIWYDSYNYAACCPLVGAEFARRMNGGAGAFREEYRHFYDDQEIKDVAELRGCYAQLPEVHLKHLHHSYGFADTLPEEKRKRIYEARARSERIYNQRKAAGFPGHGPID